ncbi:MAG: UDP-N-acetylmuramoyl-L-alanine--D-glutamate ligase [Alphaproteobacteria bacterium]
MTIDLYKDKNVAVFGLGVSGLGVAKFLKSNGANVFVWDNNQDAVADSGFTPCDLNSADLTQFDFIVASPGISNDNPICQNAIKNKVPLVGEVQLLFQSQSEATYIGITGTNGKSTTTALISHILNSAGIKNETGGNFGIPATALNKLGKGEVYILEMSSYMLERVPDVKFDIAVFLNITEDHLQWHNTMENYYNAKAKIFNNMTANDTAIICNDDEYGKKLTNQITTPNKVIVSKNDINKDYKYLNGEHNKQNIACVIAVCKSLGIDEKIIEDSLNSFTGLTHRQQFVDKINNTTFINDSKATNTVSAQKALSAYNNIYWIAGGEKKSDDYSDLDKCINNIKKAFLIGKDADSIAKYLDTKNIPYEINQTLEKAVQSAYKESTSNTDDNIVLLSPACASFDQFKSFEARGDKFIQIIKEINNG